MRRLTVVLLLAAGLAPAGAGAELTLSGALRNETYVLGRADGALVLDRLENQLVLERRGDDWRFYADARVDAFAGAIDALVPPELATGLRFLDVRLLRAFVRYHSDLGDFTLGKTYANFGVPGVFNPFEIDRNVYVTDLSYTKEGLVALTYETALGPLSGLKAFVSPEAGRAEASGGLGVYGHVGTFDLGLVAQRLDRDANLAGVYCKGDLEVGVQAAYAYHFQDDGGGGLSEANAGLDYSFWDGQIIVSALGYYLEAPLPPVGNSLTAAGLGAVGTLSGFTAPYYVYASALYVPDEFFQARLDAFVNAEDGSSLLIPGVTWVLSDGLSLTLELLVPTGTGGEQYARDTLGTVIGLARMEAKL